MDDEPDPTAAVSARNLRRAEAVLLAEADAAAAAAASAFAAAAPPPPVPVFLEEGRDLLTGARLALLATFFFFFGPAPFLAAAAAILRLLDDAAPTVLFLPPLLPPRDVDEAGADEAEDVALDAPAFAFAVDDDAPDFSADLDEEEDEAAAVLLVRPPAADDDDEASLIRILRRASRLAALLVLGLLSGRVAPTAHFFGRGDGGGISMEEFFRVEDIGAVSMEERLLIALVLSRLRLRR